MTNTTTTNDETVAKLKIKCIKILALSLMASLLYAPDSDAEYTLKKSLHLREEYNDNIFLSEENRESDFITTITPSLKLVYHVSKIELAFDYGLNFRLYADHSDQNDTSLDRSQNGKFDSTMSLYKDIVYLKIFDEYKRVPIDQREKVAIDNVLVNMTDMNFFAFNPFIQYPLSGTLTAKAGYIYENKWYRDNPESAVFDHTVDVSMTKELSQKLSSTVSYSYLFHRPRLLADRYNNQNATVGIEYQVTPKLFFTGTGGHSWFNYETGQENSSTIWSTTAKYLLSGKAAVSAAYFEKFNTAVLSGTFKQKSGSVSLEYAGDIPLTLTFFRSTDTYELIDRSDEGTGASLRSSFVLGSRLSGSFLTNYTRLKFLPKGEETDRLGAVLSMVYQANVTAISFGYTYNLTDSDAAGGSFRNNIIWAQAGVTF